MTQRIISRHLTIPSRNNTFAAAEYQLNKSSRIIEILAAYIDCCISIAQLAQPAHHYLFVKTLPPRGLGGCGGEMGGGGGTGRSILSICVLTTWACVIMSVVPFEVTLCVSSAVEA